MTVVSDVRATKPPRILAVFLLVAGVIGFLAAFALTLDKFELLENPDSVLNCDFGVLVQCTANLDSPQGALFGFPNPIIGLAGFTAVIAMGTVIFASGNHLARWFWLLFNVGVAGALAFVIWLISQSIFVLGTLCPWCMVTWSVTIPLFWAVTLYNAKTGNIPLPAWGRRIAHAAYGWVPLITLVSYLIVALLAQLRLDVISYL